MFRDRQTAGWVVAGVSMSGMHGRNHCAAVPQSTEVVFGAHRVGCCCLSLLRCWLPLLAVQEVGSQALRAPVEGNCVGIPHRLHFEVCEGDMCDPSCGCLDAHAAISQGRFCPKGCHCQGVVALGALRVAVCQPVGLGHACCVPACGAVAVMNACILNVCRGRCRLIVCSFASSLCL